MSGYYGDFRTGQTIRIRFNTVSTASVPTTLTSGAVIVSKDGADVTPSGGVTLTVDVGSVTGRHTVVIDTSVDTTTFTAGSEYAVRLSGSSAVAGTSVVGIVVGEFSLLNRSVLPDASGQVKVQYGTATGQFNLSAGNLAGAVPSVTGAVGSVTGAVGSVTGNVGGNVIGSVGSIATGGIGSASFANNSITAAAIATNAIDADALATDAVAEIQSGLSTHSAADVWAAATRTLTAGTNIVLAKGTGITGFNDITAADVWTATTRTLSAFTFSVTVGTNNDKTGYTLSQTFPANFADLAISATTGRVQVQYGTAAGQVNLAAGNLAGPVPSVTGAVGSVAADGITAASLAADAITEIQAGLSTLTAGGVQGALTAQGYTTGRSTLLDHLDADISDAGASVAAIVTGVWGEAIPGAYGAGTAAAKLSAAGGSGDPWATALPGSYAAGTAGAILADRASAAAVAAVETAVDVVQDTVNAVAGDVTGIAADYAQRDVSPTWWVAPPGDYQRQDVAVVLPTSPPAVYIAPTVEEIDAQLSDTHGATAWGSAGALTAAAVWEYAGGRSLTDKDGFRLAADGVDAIEVEAGVNLRQATSIIFAAEGGQTDGAATNLFTIFAGNHPTVERIRGAVTADGERTTVQLTLPD